MPPSPTIPVGPKSQPTVPGDIELSRIPSSTSSVGSSSRASSYRTAPEGLTRQASPVGSTGSSAPRRSPPPRRSASEESLDPTFFSARASVEEAPRTPTPAHLDETRELAEAMPGSFPALPHRPLAHPTIHRAPSGLASLDAPVVPSHRDVNPRMDLSALSQKLPEDVTGCVAYMLSSMRKSPDDIPALKALATQQTQALGERNITTREEFVSMLKQVQWRDIGTGTLHGMASSNGFNVGSALVDFKLADLTLSGLSKAMPDLPAALPGLAAGAALGLGLSIMDVAAGASASKTFGDAYFTRPPEDKLPAPLRGANPPTKASTARDATIAAGLSYGAARNGGLRAPMMLAFEAAGQPVNRALADNIADTVGGSIIGGGGMRTVLNDRDVGAGRAGLQHFLARSDLGECIDHLNKPALEQIESGLRRTVDYMKNVGTTLPEAIENAFASKLGWTSHAILSPGFGALFSMLTTMPNQLQKRGWPEKDANIATQLCKFAVLQVLYHAWGGALGAVGGPRARAPEANSAV